VAGEHGLDDHAVLRLAVLLDALGDPDAPTTVHAAPEAVDIHIADSLAGLALDELRTASSVADLGSGAGLPGLALAAALPDATVTCVESAGRKAAFIEATAEAMGLANAPVRPIRVEEWSEGSCDVVCARALAPLAVLVEYAAPILRPGGMLVAWKGEVSEDEAAAGAVAAELVGLAPRDSVQVRPFAAARHRWLHRFEKVSETPSRFPRRPGMAVKRPLAG
jgi:16S rRNA (guanine527-N7)-methyltransferase